MPQGGRHKGYQQSVRTHRTNHPCRSCHHQSATRRYALDRMRITPGMDCLRAEFVTPACESVLNY